MNISVKVRKKKSSRKALKNKGNADEINENEA